jgi:hypothetical protein
MSISHFVTRHFQSSCPFLSKQSETFHFFGTVTDIVPYGLHNFEQSLACGSVPENIFEEKLLSKS